MDVPESEAVADETEKNEDMIVVGSNRKKEDEGPSLAEKVGGFFVRIGRGIDTFVSSAWNAISSPFLSKDTE